MTRVAWNPGGLVAVWAEENTRASLFGALKRREVYATSGPRMRVRLLAAGTPLSCAQEPGRDAVPMGGELPVGEGAFFRVEAQADGTPLAAVEIIRGELEDGELRETVVEVWRSEAGAADLCVAWRDEGFNRGNPAFWYARVQETPTPRWSAYRCQREGRCGDFPEADRWLRERAWTSPVWHHPELLP